jgi:hypothetical protein
MAGVPECAGVRSLAILLLALAGCGGSKVLEEPRTLTLEAPLATGADERLELHLDWVVVRDGPGSWVRHAEWDQYLLRIGNLSSNRVRITRAVLHDAQDVPVEPSAAPPTLIRTSRETSRRYRDAGLRVRAGAGGKGMLAAGYVAGTAGYGLSMAVLYGSAAPAASGLAIGAIGAGAVLMVGGVVQSYREDRIAREMIKRHTPLPYDIDPGIQQVVNWFFPLTPSPRRLEVHYVDRAGQHKLVLDTRDPLDGLHLGATREQEPR